MNRLIQFEKVTSVLFVAFGLTCSRLVPLVRAACREGCDIPNGNAFLGNDAVAINTHGSCNTATGNDALLSNTRGSYNTANGFNALN